jgi:two-component system alkaline phosphatase synthesis response regulator PhoP
LPISEAASFDLGPAETAAGAPAPSASLGRLERAIEAAIAQLEAAMPHAAASAMLAGLYTSPEDVIKLLSLAPGTSVWSAFTGAEPSRFTTPGDGSRLAGLQEHGGRVPIIALMHRRDLSVKLFAFGQGADDVLTVPFPLQEFVARVLAVMRRTYRDALVFTPAFRLGDLEIDILHRHVRVGNTLHLTALEQSLLYLLAVNAGRLVTRDEIMDHLWGTDYAAESNVIDRHVRNVRVKLLSHSPRRYIATVPGRGYMFVANPARGTHRMTKLHDARSPVSNTGAPVLNGGSGARRMR